MPFLGLGCQTYGGSPLSILLLVVNDNSQSPHSNHNFVAKFVVTMSLELVENLSLLTYKIESLWFLRFKSSIQYYDRIVFPNKTLESVKLSRIKYVAVYVDWHAKN